MIVEKTFFLLPYKTRSRLYKIYKNKTFNRLQEKRSIVTNDYSYKSFDHYKCIFIHIPKTAGISLSKTLFGNLGPGHISIKKYQIIYSKEEFLNYFKFTFVRNPWERVFSAYSFLKNGGMNEIDEKWAAINLKAFDNFEEFIKIGLFKRNIRRHLHFKPQYKFLLTPYNKKILVDFIGFFENIENDFKYIKNKLSMDADVYLKHENKSGNRKHNYKDYYTNEMKDIVAHIYKKDIEIFGYNFDNSSLKQQLDKRWSLIDDNRNSNLNKEKDYKFHD